MPFGRLRLGPALGQAGPPVKLRELGRPMALRNLRCFPIAGSAAPEVIRSALLVQLPGPGRALETEKERQTEPQLYFLRDTKSRDAKSLDAKMNAKRTPIEPRVAARITLRAGACHIFRPRNRGSHDYGPIGESVLCHTTHECGPEGYLRKRYGGRRARA